MTQDLCLKQSTIWSFADNPIIIIFSKKSTISNFNINFIAYWKPKQTHKYKSKDYTKVKIQQVRVQRNNIEKSCKGSSCPDCIHDK